MELAKMPDDPLLLVMEKCSGRDLLRLSRTCKRFNDLLTKDEQLMKKIQFKIDLWDFYSDKSLLSLTDLLSNNRIRQYQNLELKVDSEHFEDTNDRNFLEIALKAFGKVKKLKIELRIGEDEDYDLLDGFAQVEELEATFFWMEYDSFPDDARAPMTNLKKLTFNGECKSLKYFESCTSLTDFMLNTVCFSEDETKIAEDFLLQQKNLKHLKLHYTINDGEFITIFDKDRSAEVPFQLESLSIDSDVCGANMHKFIAQQKSLIQCTFDGSYESPAAINKVLKAMLMLPQLQSLTVKSVTSITDLKGIRNTSIKKFTMNFVKNFSEVLEDLVLICQNAEIIVRSGWIIELKDLPSEVLQKFKLPDCEQFRYQPESIPEDQHAFEEHVLAFIRRHSKIKSLTIGHKDWLHREAFGLSLGFIKDLLQFVPALKSLEIYSNAGARHLFGYLASNESKLVSLNVYYGNGNFSFKNNYETPEPEAESASDLSESD